MKEGGVIGIGLRMGAWSIALKLLSFGVQSRQRGVDFESGLEGFAGAFAIYLSTEL